MGSKKESSLPKILWDAWCLITIIGIWPRFIEPRLLSTSRISAKVPGLPQDLAGFKVLQFSDLHMLSSTSDAFYERLIKKVKNLKPDLIVFTGDFICYSEIKEEKKLVDFLNRFQVPCGCFAIFGNHDYAARVALDKKGDYDLVKEDSFEIIEGFRRLLFKQILTGKTTEEAKKIPVHPRLKELVAKTPFKLLHNESVQISVGNTHLNICGLGEHTLGRDLPEIAFSHYDKRYPGIILAHNPDSIPLLLNYPGDLILCGHTHGGQVNLPWMCNRLTLMENPEFKRGLSKIGNKTIYVNRGVGSPLPFRWFSTPELALFTLEPA